MMLGAVRMALAFCVAGGLCVGLCQDRNLYPPSPDPAAYVQFFRDVSANGTTIDTNIPRPPVPKIQDVIGLTDAEVDILAATAEDCLSRMATFQKASAALTLESRLEFVESGKHSEALTRRFKQLEDQQNEMVLNQVRQLKATLLDASFAKVDAYVRTPADARKSLSPSYPKPPGAPPAASKK